MGARATQPKMQVGKTTLLDDEDNAMLKAHAYLCNQDGKVEVLITQGASAGQAVICYDDSDSNPAAGGDIREHWSTGAYGEGGYKQTLSFIMAKGRYFEILTTADVAHPTLVIRWAPFGTLIQCTDYN